MVSHNTIVFSFLTIGSILHIKSKRIVDIQMRYDDECHEPKVPPFAKDDKMRNFCILEIDYPMHLPQRTVYVYYQLENFYQANRYYEKSISHRQVGGSELEVEELESCAPYITNE